MRAARARNEGEAMNGENTDHDRHGNHYGLDLRAHDLCSALPSTVFHRQGGSRVTRDELISIQGELFRRGLTKTEAQVCCELYDLPSDHVLAERMRSSKWAVQFHLRQIFKKLNLQSRTRLFGFLESIIHERRIEHLKVQTEAGVLYKGSSNGKI